MRREIPLLITALVGLFMILSFFIPFPLVRDPAAQLQEWFLLIAAFAIVLGVGNLIRVNLHRIRRRGEDWGFKVVTLVALFAYAIIGLVLDVNLDVRPSWLTRALGLVAPDEKAVLEGRLRLSSRQAEMAAAVEGIEDAAGRRDALLAGGFGLDAVQAEDLAELGAAGIRALDARTTLADLRAEWEKEEPDRRRESVLEGRLLATGLRPVVEDTVRESAGRDEARRALRARFAFTWDQADDLAGRSPEELAAMPREATEADLRRLGEGTEAAVLDGRERLLPQTERVLAILEDSPSPERAAAALVEWERFDPEIQAPDLAALGRAGVRALDAREIDRQLRAATDPAERRRLEGRLRVTGTRPLVIDILRSGGDRAAQRASLVEGLGFTEPQADDLLALGAAGVEGVTRATLDADLKRLAERVRNPADWLFNYVYTPLQATMFSLLAFFIASAAFRAFRMRSVEAGLLLAAGVLVMIGRVPLGQFDWGIARSDFGFHTIMDWIMGVPTTAAMRGIKMGAAMGVIVMGLKVILGIERSDLGGD
jgi:hypothetical protein